MIDRDLEPDDAIPPASCPRCFSKEAWITFCGGIQCPDCEETFHKSEQHFDLLDLLDDYEERRRCVR